jgi:peptidoglycan/xylan/chitin deacetylase (PgdA/CDA1 family)
MMRFFCAPMLALALCAPAFAGSLWGVEVHDRLENASVTSSKVVAITLDACDGEYDADIIHGLVRMHVPATIFVTKKWIDRNPLGTAELLAHRDLFELEDHGTAHVPAVIGVGRRVYGLAAEPDIAHLEAEVSGAAGVIRSLTGQAPRYFRGATGIYDRQSLQKIQSMGYTIAGFSVNADAGATLSKAAIAARLRSVRPGDIVIAHMNKPAGATAEAFAATLPELLSRGYRFITLSGAQLQPI